MKKTLILLMAAGTMVFIACGPSAEEKAKVEQARLDSIELVRIADSTAAAEAMAAAAAEAAMKATQDSLAMVAMQDSMANMKANMSKPKPKAKPKAEPAPAKPADVKPGQGRG